MVINDTAYFTAVHVFEIISMTLIEAIHLKFDYLVYSKFS